MPLHSFLTGCLRKIGSHFHPRRAPRAQSYIELALVLPILLVMLLGLVEVVFFIGRYLDVLDLTREAARFASVRDPKVLDNISSVSCSDDNTFNFYFHTACIFSPPQNSPDCTDPDFCNGLNQFVNFNPEKDDIVISVYTINGHNVSNIWPQPDGNTANGIESAGYWAYSNNDGVDRGSDGLADDNWKYDCGGNVVRTTPYYDEARVEAITQSFTSTTATKGFVAAEFYYCYEQALGIPLFTVFVPNSLRIHAYTLMPLPAAAPTDTP